MSAPQNSSSDLFEHLQVQTAYRQFGDNQSGWFMVMDRAHRFQFVNKSFAESIGKSQAEIVGNRDADLGLPDALLFGDPDAGLPGVHLRDEQCMSTGEPMRTIDGAVDLGEGGFDSTLTIRTPMFGESGEVIGLIVQALDHSAVRRLEIEIQSADETAFALAGKLSTLDQVLADLLVCHNRTELLHKITDTVVSQTSAMGAYMATPDESGEFMQLIAANGFNAEQVLGCTYRRGEDMIGKAWQKKEVLYTDDAVASGSIDKYEKKTQLCALPVFDGDEVVAVMSAILQGEDDTRSLKDDVATLRRVVSLAGIALSNERLLNTTRTALQQSRMLAEISHRLVAVDTRDEACKLVCEAMVPSLPVCGAAVVLFDKNGEFDSILSSLSDRFDASTLEESLPDLRLIAQSCFDFEQLITLSAAECTAINNGVECIDTSSWRNAYRTGGEFHLAAVPLYGNDQLMGVLAIVRNTDQPPLEHALLDTLTTVAVQLGTTLERQELSRALRHQAFHDRLTGLPNRHRFESVLQGLLDQQTSCALLFIDLDGFKGVNDTRGHGVGDQLLHLAAARINSRLAPEDVLTRMGGDEFAVILYSPRNRDEEIAAGEIVLEALKQPFLIDNTSISIGASIGLSRFPDDGDSVDTLLRNADVAMYQAKHNGKGCLLSFDSGLAEELRQRAQLQADIIDALEDNQFELHYQPQVCCESGQVLGVEALLRWNHPMRGNVSPVEFIPAAEQANLINDIGTWVLERAVRQISDWQGTPLGILRVSVNIAATQFQQEEFTDFVLSTLEHYGAPSHLLELEVTESVVMNDVGAVITRLHQLREAGIRIAVDDFGTGYSSLSYLQDLPLDVLKIDRTFVNRLQEESAGQSLANTITLLANGLGLDTVAEGVETVEQRDAVVGMGCQLIQGFFHSKAVPANELCRVVKRLHAEVEILNKVA